MARSFLIYDDSDRNWLPRGFQINHLMSAFRSCLTFKKSSPINVRTEWSTWKHCTVSRGIGFLLPGCFEKWAVVFLYIHIFFPSLMCFGSDSNFGVTISCKHPGLNKDAFFLRGRDPAEHWARWGSRRQWTVSSPGVMDCWCLSCSVHYRSDVIMP